MLNVLQIVKTLKFRQAKRKPLKIFKIVNKGKTLKLNKKQEINKTGKTLRLCNNQEQTELLQIESKA